MATWTVRACRRLSAVLAEAACRKRHTDDGTDVVADTMKQLEPILAQTFPDADQVVVQEEFVGFRSRENLHILLVDVFQNNQPRGTYVVKIGPVQVLEKELLGWNRSRPVGLHNDLVFLPLSEGHRCPTLKGNRPAMMSLVYGDAHQFLGVETISTLEAVALKAVQFSSPSLISVGLVLVELYERLGHLFYSKSFVVDPGRKDFFFELRHLEDNLQRWEKDPAALAARCDANTLANSGAGQFLDPVDYLQYVQKCVPWRDDNGVEHTPNLGEFAAQPRAVDVVPRLLRGCAHGDLHGRNVLVGVVHERALWPTVFDYEDMSPCNYLGWDFVKLETEIKVRAYVEVFSGGPPVAFVRQVQQAEIALNRQTEKCHGVRAWPALGENGDPATRLAALLLELRRLAALHLGIDRGRPNDWLEEYYFLLACYGVTTVRFANVLPRERLATLLSAGVATARLSWPRHVLELGDSPGSEGNHE
jgi:hypothetical protein